MANVVEISPYINRRTADAGMLEIKGLFAGATDEERDQFERVAMEIMATARAGGEMPNPK